MLQAERAGGHYIDGKFQGRGGGESLTVWRPATGEPLGSVPVATASDVDRAVASATDAFREWRAVSAFDREAMLTAIADLIVERRTELAELECANTGKRPSVGLAEVDGAAEVFRFYAGYPTKERGTHIDGGERDVLRYTRLEPLGVVGAITPWNYPLLIATVKVAAALAAGCTVVLKPAPETPLTSLALAQVVSDAGLPTGTLNVVTGDGSSGHHLASHPGVAKVSFTGSTATGRKVAVAAGENARPVTMELGGKSPNIVFDDVDLDAAVTPILMGALANSGQECCAGARILVQQCVYDTFLERAAARMESLAVGADDDAEVGPLISERQRERVRGFVDRAREAGATVRAQGATPSEGFYFPPTLIADVDDDMEACREEIFGPVVTVQRFGTDDDALRMGNDTRYGLAAGIWSRSIDRALRFSGELEAGQVWINAYLNGGTLMPFGGAKDSGFGRELGLDGPREFSYVKSVAIAGAPGEGRVMEANTSVPPLTTELDERYRAKGEVFRVSVPDTVLYGRGAAAHSVSELSPEQLARVFVLTDGNLRKAGVGDELVAALQEVGEPVIHERVPGEPTASEIDGIADAAREANPTAIVAIGGGATMDSAKCVRLLLDQGGRIRDYYDRQPATDSPIALPLVTVATTAGTGSEAVGAGLLVDDATREKTAISSPHMRADVAVVDPDLTLSVPPSATAATGCDALAQAIGPFIGPRRHPVTDALAGEAIRLITANLPVAVHSGKDVEARSAVAYGSLMSGLAMANTEAMADQFFDEVLGPRYRIPHGTVAGIVLPYVLQFNRLEASDRIALIAPLVTSEPASSEAHRVDQVIRRMAALVDEVELPRLADLVPAEDLPELARDTAQHPGVDMGINPGLITEQVALKVLEGAWRREDPLSFDFG